MLCVVVLADTIVTWMWKLEDPLLVSKPRRCLDCMWEPEGSLLVLKSGRSLDVFNFGETGGLIIYNKSS